MKIWAHRGCSQCYPENTLTAFEKAMNIQGLEGIELDIQLTKDGQIVVIHDEKVDRTTEGTGYVREYSLSELKRLHIRTEDDLKEHIPTMEEVFDLLAPKMREGTLRLNIELKNGVFYYIGMEDKIVDMVAKHGVEDAIVYSSFYPLSLTKVHALNPKAEIGVLNGKLSNCLYMAKGMEQIADYENKLALHPGGMGLDIPREEVAGRTVRAYFGGHLYPSKPTGGRMDLEKLEAAGVTDVFLNEPERYL